MFRILCFLFKEKRERGEELSQGTPSFPVPPSLDWQPGNQLEAPPEHLPILALYWDDETSFVCDWLVGVKPQEDQPTDCLWVPFHLHTQSVL